MNIELIIPSRKKDLGGFIVGRILPYAKRRMIGPFIFFDHMGPAEFGAGAGIDVRPHPHIGLATVTYLFEGEIIHRDSLGSHQAITPGAVNWMTAGRGITHSERTGASERGHVHHVHGIQSWVALPKEVEECEPEFFHHSAQSLPQIDLPGATLRIIAGQAYAKQSPVKIHSPLFYVEARLQAGASLPIPQEYSERAVYVVSGEVSLEGQSIPAGTLAVLGDGQMDLASASGAHVMLLGGEPLAEPRYIDWNFVSSSKERIEKSKRDWQEGHFDKVPGDDKEFIPLPTPPKEGTIL